MSTTIDTTQIPYSPGYSTTRGIDRCSNGVLWALRRASNSVEVELYYSTDDGFTWTLDGPISTINYGSNYVSNAALFIDEDDFAHVLHREPSNGTIRYRRGTPNTARTSWTWSNEEVVFSNYTYVHPDIVVHRQGTGWKVHAVAGNGDGSSYMGAYYRGITISSAGVLTFDPSQVTIASYTSSLNTKPSIDFHHTGNGKSVQGGTPHLYIAWSGGSGVGVRFKKVTYSAGTWTFGTERGISATTHYVPNDRNWVNCLFDGTRVVIGGCLYDSTYNQDTIRLFERNVADTSTTTLVAIDDPSVADVIYNGTLSYNGDGDVLFIGRSDSTNYPMYHRRYRRSTDTFEAKVQFSYATNASSVRISAKRGFSSKRMEWIYTEGGTTPYSLKYESIPANRLPSAPTVTVPNGSEIWDQSHTITWAAGSDPDGDPLIYNVELTTNGGGSWKRLVSGTSALSYTYNFASEPQVANARIRVQAIDSSEGASPWDESNANFSIVHQMPTPTNVTPGNGSTVNTDVPTLSLSLVNNGLQQKGEWQLATDAAFTANVRTVTQANTALKTSGTQTMAVPSASQLSQGVWYLRARSVGSSGANPSDWSATNAITVAHKPTSINHDPSGSETVAFGDGTVTMSATFSDTSTVDSMTAGQVVLERNDTGVLLNDSGKQTQGGSTFSFTTSPLAASLKDVTLRWKIRLWDSDDVAGDYSSYHLFTLRDVPVVEIITPGDGSHVNSGQPLIEWSVQLTAGRSQASRRVFFTRVSDGSVVHDTGMQTSATLSYSPPSVVLENIEDYTVTVQVVDTVGLLGEDENNFSTEYDQPEIRTFAVDASDADRLGYVKVNWSNDNLDPDWVAFRVYRRLVGGTWSMLQQYTSSVANYQYKDYLFGSGYPYEYAVVQVVNRFGAEIESPLVPQEVTPVSSHYWVVFGEQDTDSFKLDNVTGEDPTEEYETETINLIGRGRHREYGTRYGWQGEISAQLRSDQDRTARDKWLQLREMKSRLTWFYLRNPFGDLWAVAAGDISLSRMPGVGLDEVGTATIPYAEVSE